MRFRLRTLLILVAVGAVVAFGVALVNRQIQKTQGAYAVWWAADMCIEHMAANDDEWPRGWDDLRDDYATCVARSGQPWTFDELTDRVEIDWNANPKQVLTRTDDPAEDFRVIWLRNGSNAHWAGAEPNEMVFEYLRQQKAPGS